ncbi:hypothetical protein TNCV_5030931 [Trichonephila clavipes]|nr:hypothetical protein TNCV_5030931 [Trichonephila clavipes]
MVNPLTYVTSACGRKNPGRPPTVNNLARLSERHFVSHIPPPETGAWKAVQSFGVLTGSHNEQRSAHRGTRDEACLTNKSDTLEDYERIDLRNKGGVEDKCVQMLDEKSGTIRFQTVRECICALRANRTLMRPRAGGRLWWPANDKGREACYGSTPGA